MSKLIRRCPRTGEVSLCTGDPPLLDIDTIELRLASLMRGSMM
jgi:hypothetical protein